MSVSVFIPCILDVRFVDVPAGVTREEVHTGFLCLPSAVLAVIIFARNFQSLFSLVDREVEFCVLMNYNRSPLVGYLFIIIIFLRGKIPVRATLCLCSFLFLLFLLPCFRWSFVDVALIFSCSADLIPDWQPRILLGRVEVRLVNNVNNIPKTIR